MQIIFHVVYIFFLLYFYYIQFIFYILLSILLLFYSLQFFPSNLKYIIFSITSKYTNTHHTARGCCRPSVSRSHNHLPYLLLGHTSDLTRHLQNDVSLLNAAFINKKLIQIEHWSLRWPSTSSISGNRIYLLWCRLLKYPNLILFSTVLLLLLSFQQIQTQY